MMVYNNNSYIECHTQRHFIWFKKVFIYHQLHQAKIKELLSIKMFYKNNVILLCMKRACICYISYAGSVPTAEWGQGH